MTPAVSAHLWTAAEAMAATAGRTAGDWAAEGVSIDSRTARPGDLFVAIRGPRFDGHEFAAAALAAGAAAAVVDNDPVALEGDGRLLHVDDTTRALDDLGRAGRRRTAARVAAVTGSVGKTGTKEALRHVLADQGPTAASEGNLNNHWGLPLSLARMPVDASFGVFEIGMNHAGEITPLARLARPDVAVVTTVEPVHSGFFDSVEAIADAKAEIFDGMAADGVAVLNRDNAQFERLRRAAGSAGVETVIGFGAHEDAEVRLTGVGADCQGADVDAVVLGRAVGYRLGVPGRHWVQNSLAVLAAVYALGADVDEAAAALAGMSGLKGRGRRHTVEIAGGAFVVLDESYNASPVSMRAAFEVLGQIRPDGDGRRIAVLGDMLELGDESEALHAGLAESLAAESIDLVFAAGQYMDALWSVLPAAMRGGTAPSTAQIVPMVTAAVRPGDVIVVKGSAGARTGAVVDALLAMGAPAGTRPARSNRAVNG